MYRHFQIGFSAADSVTSLKLIEQGVPKDKLAMLAIPMIPVQVLEDTNPFFNKREYS